MDRLASMETFVAAVEAGSFSAAARQLEVGQPAVSKSIAQLEDKLGVRLLLRSAHGLTLTEAGQSYFEHARRAIDAADQAEQAARGAGASLSGRLRFCAAVTFSRLHVMPHLPAFLAANPGLSIDAILDDRQIDLLEAGVDVALRMGDLPDSSMTARHLAQGRRVVVATPAYLARAAAGEPRTPDELSLHEAVSYSTAGTVQWTFRRGDVERPVALSGRLQSSAAEGVRAAVLADAGYAVVSDWMFAPELASGAVRELLLDWTLPPLDLWAVFPSGRMPSAKAQAFAAFVRAVTPSSGPRAPQAAVATS